MRLRSWTNLTIGLAIAVALQIAWITVAPDYFYDGVIAKAGASAIGKPVAKYFPGSRHQSDVPSCLGLSKIAGDLGLRFTASLFRFDLKQNLSTWPVFSNGLARSPPTFAVL